MCSIFVTLDYTAEVAGAAVVEVAVVAAEEDGESVSVSQKKSRCH